MAQIYNPRDKIGLEAFVKASSIGPHALQDCWDTPGRNFLIDDAMKSGELDFCRSDNALQAAVKSGNRDSIEWLLDHGANLDAVDFQGMSSLLTALSSRQWEEATTLLELGASTNAVPWGSYYLGGRHNKVTAQPATLFALACSTEAVQFLADAGVQPTNEDLVTGPAAEDFSFLSSVTDCQRGAVFRPRPPLHELLPLMRLASRHVTAAQHYALCEAPLVCNATLDGAIVYLTGAGADGTGTDKDVRALCVPNSRLLEECCLELGNKVLRGGMYAADHYNGWSMPKPPPFPLWVEQSFRIKEHILPAVLVAVWGSRCPAMRFVARLCGAPGVPAAAEDVPFPLAPVEPPAAPSGRRMGWSQDIGSCFMLAGGLEASALLAAVAACQVAGAVTGTSCVEDGGEQEAMDVSPAAVRILAAWAAGVLLCTVRQLQAQVSRAACPRVREDAVESMQLLMGGYSITEDATAESGAEQLFVPSHSHNVTSLDGAVDLLQFSRQEKRLMCDSEIGIPSFQRWSYCMSPEDMGALLGFATWRLRRGLLLRRMASRGSG